MSITAPQWKSALRMLEKAKGRDDIPLVWRWRAWEQNSIVMNLRRAEVELCALLTPKLYSQVCLDGHSCLQKQFIQLL